MPWLFWRGLAQQPGKRYGVWHTLRNSLPGHDNVFKIRERFLIQHKLQEWQQFSLYKNSFRFRVFNLIGNLAFLICGIHWADYHANGGSSYKGDSIFRAIECEQAKSIAFC